MRYSLNLAESGRILSATFPQFAPVDGVIVDALPEGDISDYLYQDGGYVYDPLPETEQTETESPETDTAVWDELDAAYTAGYNAGYEEGVNAAYVNE